ncbi:hypothetical protein MJ575_21160 [Klebsiella pneumoniae]|nr:hypothetical protein MJ575_21160 [Klebsiella pneumoniae]
MNCWASCCKTLKRDGPRSCRYFYEEFATSRRRRENICVQWRVSRWKCGARDIMAISDWTAETSITRFRQLLMSWRGGDAG